MNKTKSRSLALCAILISLTITAYAQVTQTNTDANLEAAGKLEAQMLARQAEVSYYNTACYFALAGKQDLAFRYLNVAVENGFANLKTYQTDGDLVSLHNDARWPDLLKKVEGRSVMQQKLAGLFFNKETFWESSAINTPYRQNISEDEKIAGLSKFWSEVKYNYVNFDLIPDVNFDSLYLAWLPKVRQTKSTLEYYLELEKLGAKLRDGHTNIIMPRELADSVYTRPMLRTRLIEDRVLIVGVYDPALSQRGIAVGQEVVKVNGIPVKEYSTRYVIPTQISSTPQYLLVRGYDFALLRGSLNKPITLQLRDASNKIAEHTISRAKSEERSRKFQVPAFEYRMLPGNIAYVALNTFANDSTAILFTKRFEEISKAKAIIFDVRNNGGGSTNPGWKILSYLIDKPVMVHTAYTRDYRPAYRAWNNSQVINVFTDYLSPAKKFLYTKPVIVLTSARTFSAAEDFAAAFKSMGRGLIMGEATGGSSGQPLGISLPGNGSAVICTKRDMLGNGEDFVGKGVLPDKVVAPTVNDVRRGIDTELQAAISELNRK